MENDDLYNIERQVVSRYINNGTAPEDRIETRWFCDPISVAGLQTIEELESEGKTVCNELVTARFAKAQDLPADPGKIVSLIVDHVTMDLCDVAFKQLEGEVRIEQSARILKSRLQESISDLKSNNPPINVVESLNCSLAEFEASLTPFDWTDPEPLFSTSKNAKPFPLDALPPLLRDAIKDVERATQAPVSLAASSALSYASLSCQHLANIKRAEHLIGPISIFTLTVAESGERKSACDQMLATGLKRFQHEARERIRPELSEWESEHLAWKAENDGILSAITLAAKKREETTEHKKQLKLLGETEPKPPRIPDLIMENETPASFRTRMSYMNPTAWLSSALMTSEGGTFFGGHGMSRDTSLDYLACLNRLWDGGEVRTNRRGDGKHDIDGARLTVGIAAQEQVVRDFCNATMARNSGYLARFLINAPESKRGFRAFNTVANLYSLDRFNDQVARLLSAQPNRDELGRIVPEILSLSAEAKERWIEYFNETELRQLPGRDLHDFSDVASKTADHAVRLSGIFHFFLGNDAATSVGLEAMEGACEVASWYLDETVKFLSHYTADKTESDASTLIHWLCLRKKENRNEKLNRRLIQQFGPANLRKQTCLDSAISLLVEKHQVRTRQVGKAVQIEINPSLL